MGLVFCYVYSGVNSQFSHKSLNPLEYLLRRVFCLLLIFYGETRQIKQFVWRKTRDSAPIDVHSAPKPDPISVLWTTRQRPVNTRQKITVTIEISMTSSEPVATKEPWDVHLRAKILAEDMVCEPLRLLLKFQRFRVTESGQTQCCPQRFHHTVISDIVLI